MTISYRTIIENLPLEEREMVEKRAAELIAEEMTERQGASPSPLGYALPLPLKREVNQISLVV